MAGIDIGGTWIRVLVLESGRTRARARMPANRLPQLGTFLRKYATGAPAARARLAALVVASTGVWTTRERASLARRFRAVSRRVDVVSDAQAAFVGALGDGPGLLVLSGTGSIVIGRDGGGRWGRAGGLGPLLGDEGSGFWLGREWLRVTTQGEDFMPARRLVRAPDAVRRIAALAPSVMRRARRGDRRARTIVRSAQEELAALAARLARQLGMRPPIDVSWAGRIMADDAFRRGVARSLARAGWTSRWHAPRAAPVVAAAALAERLAASDGRARSFR